MTWKQICADPMLAQWPFRVESDKWGNAVLSPPPGYQHSSYQGEIILRLGKLMPAGRVLSECPIRTTEGVKATDVAWASRKWVRQQPLSPSPCLVAPEVCVEIISPSNSKGKTMEKFDLYFNKGAQECWLCDKKGVMSFYAVEGRINRSRLCPEFPSKILFEV